MTIAATNTRPIPIARPSLGEEEAEAAREAILSGWVTQGPAVKRFEEEFAAFVGARHACAVSSCTAALHLALHALGVGRGDEVVTVSHSFIATANAIRYCGAEPVFVDIDPQTYNLDPSLLDAAITSRTKAIMPVHQMGMPCDLPAVCEIAARHGLPVVEDAACAIGSQICVAGDWQHIGRPHGRVACFSFHPRKILTTGDGGMLTTDDESLDRQFRLLRQHGMSVSDVSRHNASKVIFEDYPVLGFNYRMTDIQAAVGRVQLKRLNGILARRVAAAEYYVEQLRGVEGLTPPHVPDYARPNYQSFPVRVSDHFPLSRDELMRRLLQSGVSTRRGIMNAHQEPPYEGLAQSPLPHSEAARDNVVLLPLFDGITREEQERVIGEIRNAAVAPLENLAIR